MSAGEMLATAAVAAGSLLVSAGGGLWLVPAVLRGAARTGTAEADAAAAGTADDAGTDDDAGSGATDALQPASAPAADGGPTSAGAVLALRGGTWIGLLERLAVTGCVVAGFPSGIAVVVAVKGLGRYPEIRDNPGVSERFVVGTLASWVWAGFVGWVALRALGRIG